MTRRTSRALLSLVLLGAALPCTAQWGPHSSGRVPQKAGAPDLDARAPRTADGKVDLSGVWQSPSGGLGGAPPPPMTFSEGPPVAGFLDIAQNIKGGAPLNPEGAKLLEQRKAVNGRDNPEAACLPMGILQFHTQGAPRKIIQTRDVLVIL